jgi:hypothetical protein
LNPCVLQTLLNFITRRATISFSIRTLRLRFSHNLIEVVNINIYIYIYTYICLNKYIGCPRRKVSHSIGHFMKKNIYIYYCSIWKFGRDGYSRILLKLFSTNHILDIHIELLEFHPYEDCTNVAKSLRLI